MPDFSLAYQQPGNVLILCLKDTSGIRPCHVNNVVRFIVTVAYFLINHVEVPENDSQLASSVKS